jgi:thiopurine S-methyltransferase
MEPHFWHNKWHKNEIGFHQDEVNTYLKAHFSLLAIPKNSRIFVPLCGKTQDIGWLLAQGYRVAGAELSELAINQLFTQLGIQPTISVIGDLHHYKSDNIDIYVGDIFALSKAQLGQIHAIYDRAAVVALPEEIRMAYSNHLVEITGKAPQLVITCEYDQSLISGPPFNVSHNELENLYGSKYSLTSLASEFAPRSLKGRVDAINRVWQLK